jgi:hypothetical protein
MTENFTSNTSQTAPQGILPPFSPTTTTKLSEGVAFMNSVEGILQSLKKKVKDLPATVTNDSMTDDEASIFGFTKVDDPDTEGAKLIQLPMMSSDEQPKYFNINTAKQIILERIERDTKDLDTTKLTVKNAISTNSVKPTDRLLDAITKIYPDYPPQMAESMITMFPSMYANVNKLYTYIDSFAKKNTTITTTEEKEEEKEEEKDEEKDEDEDTTTSENSINNITMGSLWSAIGPIGDKNLKKKINKTSDKITNKTTNKTTDKTESTVPESTYAPADCSSGVKLSEETESRLVKNMMSQIKDQLLINRKLDNPQDSSYSDADADTDKMDCPSNCAQQGSEWKEKRPDMSRYIRKDSIPCWNCSP